MRESPIHGGDVWRVASEYAIPASQLLDFSANVNPRGLPAGARRQLLRDAADVSLLMRYPDPCGDPLRAALSSRLGVPERSIVVGEGAEALLAAAVRSLGARHCLVPVPSFSEYARVCAASGATLHPFALNPTSNFRLAVEKFGRMLRSGQWDTAIVNNPHNPSGALLGSSELWEILEAAAHPGTGLVLDEAFIDYAEHASLVRTAAERSGVIVVRSLTKFYGCPALRVGYAVGTPECINRVAGMMPTWPVTLLALNAMTEALLDEDYARATLQENSLEQARLSAGFARLGAAVFPSAANYLLVQLKEEWASAPQLRDRLIREHCILVRNCDSYDGLKTGRYVRIAVRSADENDRLLGALETVLKGQSPHDSARPDTTED
ncbi:aminotransferase class I/II-fold pyridoxal phosphate-dependent enzyme [uncultured Paludibaculum sp.]|uniref:pyridoxal phosphate-dependent aminotransferase n=1 Tax=uncultured Paludibaculum sp. TaxID=1765020 RepID=UPI002AAB35CC|nr:aminotransferase class I/II-fold pyridoxal phosphate-dependent enzyme [uncultured Paludibaculum sp.]